MLKHFHYSIFINEGQVEQSGFECMKTRLGRLKEAFHLEERLDLYYKSKLCYYEV